MELRLLSYENKNLPVGWKPYYIYEIVENNEVVGTITLREGNSQERYFDGHIGYTIDKPYRGHRYSQQACLLLMKKAKELGFQELIITCSPENIASLHIIESLPTIFIEEQSVPKHLKKYFLPEEKIKRIYRIPLEDL